MRGSERAERCAAWTVLAVVVFGLLPTLPVLGAEQARTPTRPPQGPPIDLLEYLGRLEREGDAWIGPEDVAQPNDASPPQRRNEPRTATPAAEPAETSARAGAQAARMEARGSNALGGDHRGQSS